MFPFAWCLPLLQIHDPPKMKSNWAHTWLPKGRHHSRGLLRILFVRVLSSVVWVDEVVSHSNRSDWRVPPIFVKDDLRARASLGDSFVLPQISINIAIFVLVPDSAPCQAPETDANGESRRRRSFNNILEKAGFFGNSIDRGAWKENWSADSALQAKMKKPKEDEVTTPREKVGNLASSPRMTRICEGMFYNVILSSFGIAFLMFFTMWAFEVNSAVRFAP